jgi:hypothetical protein
MCGLLVTLLFGFFVQFVKRPFQHRLGEYAGWNPALREIWPPTKKNGKNKNGLKGVTGAWVGCFERPIFFASFWMPGGWPLLTSWLVMKTAIYWQSSNFTKFPKEPPKDPDFFVSVYKLGVYHAGFALVGTAANIVAALFGYAVGKYLEGCFAYGI